MTDTKTKIAAGLETCFRQYGFSEPGVDALRDSSGVSLRTLYKYFPSREDMIVGALDYRNDRYLSFIAEGAPAAGPDAIAHLFEKVGEWMQAEEGVGCLFLNALASHPGSVKIRKAVERQKTGTQDLMAKLSGAGAHAVSLFLLHEGATAAWPLLRDDAIRSARHSAQSLMINAA